MTESRWPTEARTTRLRVLLVTAPVAQYVVAAACGIDPSTLSNYSLGRFTPSAGHLAALADYFGVPVEDVMGDVDDEDLLPEDEDQ